MTAERSPGESVAMILVLLIGVAAFNNYRRGQLGTWLWAKLANAGDVRSSALSVGNLFAGTGSTSSSSEPSSTAPDPMGLVTVGSTRMSPGFAAKMRPLIAAAAADGITIAGDAYRSNAAQKALREAHGCGGASMYDPHAHCTVPTAVPGQSRHETGDAIDLDNATSYSSPVVVWMKANAHRFGVHNLPGEPWHWSTDGH